MTHRASPTAAAARTARPAGPRPTARTRAGQPRSAPPETVETPKTAAPPEARAGQAWIETRGNGARLAGGPKHPLPRTPADWSRRGKGPSAWQRWRAIVLPLLTLVAVMGVEVSTRTWTYIGYTVLVPMVAATLAGPRLTAVFTGLALAAGGFSVWWERLWDAAHGGAPALSARLAGIVLGGAMAILASRYTAGRETKLANMTQVAEAAQRAILSDLPATSAAGLRIAVRYESAATEAMVGGDLYEMVDSPWGARFLLGDARGKGLDAVRLASRVLGCFRVVARARPDVREVLPDLDREVASVADLDDFVTCVVAQFGPDGLTLVNAGHPDPVLVRDGHATLLTPPGRQPPLGLGAGADNTRTAGLRAGDQVLFYTDGIAEAREPRTGAFFPLLPAVERALGREGSLEQNLGRLTRAVRRWTGSGLHDDAALLVVEVPADPDWRAGSRPARRTGRAGMANGGET